MLLRTGVSVISTQLLNKLNPCVIPSRLPEAKIVPLNSSLPSAFAATSPNEYYFII